MKKKIKEMHSIYTKWSNQGTFFIVFKLNWNYILVKLVSAVFGEWCCVIRGHFMFFINIQPLQLLIFLKSSSTFQNLPSTVKSVYGCLINHSKIQRLKANSTLFAHSYVPQKSGSLAEITWNTEVVTEQDNLNGTVCVGCWLWMWTLFLGSPPSSHSMCPV